MGKKKLTPVKKRTRAAPKKLKSVRDRGGRDGSYQTRMEIAVLANRGATPSQIVKELGVSFDMAQRWSDRSEEVMRTGTVQSNRKGTVGRKSKFSTPTAKKKLYKKLKRTTQKEVMLEIIEKQGGPTSFLSSNVASKS